MRTLIIAFLICIPALAQEPTPALCITCHVGKEPDDLSTFDFRSDAKQNKLNARLMLKMQNDINEKILPKVKPDPPDTEEAQVTCFTCHQKQLKPPALPSPRHVHES